MDLNQFLDVFLRNVMDSSWLEITAVIFGLLSVWYAKKAHILVYPTGIISVLIYVYICFYAKLYADMGINAFYFIMSVYGWYKWSRKDMQQHERPITYATTKNWYFASGLFIISIFVILLLLKYFKADDVEYWATYVPYVDIFTTAVFIVAMWLMAIKKVENWLFWIVGDIISVPLYLTKDLVFTSMQFAIFLYLAFLGYKEWKQMVKKEEIA